jgi:BirA family transcriptional regulator, biotin operon repressor / biotin---[acetyl-CoA-carboxylase] ligase
MICSLQYRPVPARGQEEPFGNLNFTKPRFLAPNDATAKARRPMEPSQPEAPCHAGSPDTIRIGSDAIVVHRLSSVESTQDLALARLAAGGSSAENPTFQVWIAETQRAGRGTQGRSWASPKGGLWLSMLAPLGETPHLKLPGLGIRVGLAALRAARSVLTEPAAGQLKLRWPNDLVSESTAGPPMKIGGTIVDHRNTYVIIGIGINANNEPPDRDASGLPLRTPATSLAACCGSPISLSKLEIEILTELCQLIALEATTDSLLDEADASLYRPVEPITIHARNHSSVNGIVLGLSRDPSTLGGLQMRVPDGRVVTVMSGESQ